MMSGSGDNLKTAQESQNSQQMGSIYRPPSAAPKRFYLNLQFKGFAGGVPINTETSAVNPRVGIER
jgi:hypothetical protein